MFAGSILGGIDFLATCRKRLLRKMGKRSFKLLECSWPEPHECNGRVGDRGKRRLSVSSTHIPADHPFVDFLVCGNVFQEVKRQCFNREDAVPSQPLFEGSASVPSSDLATSVDSIDPSAASAPPQAQEPATPDIASVKVAELIAQNRALIAQNSALSFQKMELESKNRKLLKDKLRLKRQNAALQRERAPGAPYRAMIVTSNTDAHRR